MATNIIARCAQGPVLAYVDEVLCKDIKEKYPEAIIVDQNANASKLRHLE